MNFFIFAEQIVSCLVQSSAAINTKKMIRWIYRHSFAYFFVIFLYFYSKNEMLLKQLKTISYILYIYAL